MDARNFIDDAKIPAIAWGSGDLATAHPFDEYIEIKQVIDCTKILALTIIDLLK